MRAILHIGTEKTGSTAIQYRLAAAREELLTHGFAYSRVAAVVDGGANHVALYRYALELEAELARATAKRGEVPRPLPQALAQEVASLKGRAHTLILSNEHLHSRVTTPEGVARIRALLEENFESVTVVVYLRRQDDLAVSRYSTSLRVGRPASLSLLDEAKRTPLYFDYEALLARWSGAFGRQAVIARLFDRQALVGGDVVADFLKVCGFDGVLQSNGPGDPNRSLPAAVQEYLHRFIEALPSGTRTRPPKDVVKRLERSFTGPPKLPSETEARAFYSLFAASNEAVRREYFPDRAMLFNDDFSKYPAAPLHADRADLMAAAKMALAQLSEARPGRRKGALGPHLAAAKRVLADISQESQA